MPGTLADIRSHRGIVGRAKGPPSVWFVHENGVEKRLTPPAPHQLSDGEAMVDAALGGLGPTQLPVFMMREHRVRGLLQQVPQEVLQDASTIPVDIHAVWHRQAQFTPQVRYVVDQLSSPPRRGGWLEHGLTVTPSGGC